MSDIKISILGGGLSALYSFWGCLDAGYKLGEIEILYPTKEMPIGAVFMYEPLIPWPSVSVTSVLLGTCDGYAENQWDQVRPTSANLRFRNGDFPVVTEQLYLYRDMMLTLWGAVRYKKQVPFLEDVQIDVLKKTRDAVIATFPNRNHRYNYKAQGFITGLPVHYNIHDSSHHVVFYNGSDMFPWVRQTILPGTIYTEYATFTNPDHILLYEDQRGNKDGKLTLIPELSPDCIPLEWEHRIEDNLLRVGRMASFTPGYLSHQARKDTERFLMR